MGKMKVFKPELKCFSISEFYQKVIAGEKLDTFAIIFTQNEPEMTHEIGGC